MGCTELAGASPRPPRGFRDFPPDLMILRKRLLSRVESVFQRYGFDPIDTPAVEYWETLAGKYGEEAENRLIWRFTDKWSGREYALRYDLTVPMARFVATHRDIPMPFKRYHIGPVWRHEEPQKGRYREFYQCDADIVGSPHPEADAEIVELVIDVIRELGFTSGFKVRLNDRRLLRGIFEDELGLSNAILPVYRAIDKLDKIGIDGVRSELQKIGLQESTVDKIVEIISIQGDPGKLLGEVSKRYGDNHLVRDAIKYLERIIGLVDSSSVVVDLSLVRGLDYYTGPILEVVLDKPRIGSVAGGGRYDGLIGIFAGTQIPATGASIGIERIIDAGLELGLYTLKQKTVTEAIVIVLDKEVYNYAWKVAKVLRKGGVKTRIDLSMSSPGVQRRKAQKLGIRLLVYVGAKEAEMGTVTIYDSISRERREVKLGEAGKAAREMLSS
ncbi:MAG: histidine--tRNA ligase [Desulfurococcales archaeon]|nr:histidine--tRNA ligase [Desulfurococcales archaeon]MCE4605311.1 histidine--tRNA ligase [Desulfurococcales archaeon]